MKVVCFARWNKVQGSGVVGYKRGGTRLVVEAMTMIQ
jgi:hypothetical protein